MPTQDNTRSQFLAAERRRVRLKILTHRARARRPQAGEDFKIVSTGVDRAGTHLYGRCSNGQMLRFDKKHDNGILRGHILAILHARIQTIDAQISQKTSQLNTPNV